MSAPQSPTPALAATVLLVRDAPKFEVLMVKRHHQIDFASGALVFPGGKIEGADADPAWAEHATGHAEGPAELTALKIAAVREAFEESALLLARRVDGGAGPAEGQGAARAAAAAGARFIDVVRDLKVRLDLDALTVFARWITPAMMPRRFDTWFFIAAAPEDQLAACDGYETVDAEWIAPSEALSLAAAGARKIIFPTRMNLQLLAKSRSAEEAVAAARGRPLRTVEPAVVEVDGEKMLTLPEDAGYGRVAEPLSAAT